MAPPTATLTSSPERILSTVEKLKLTGSADLHSISSYPRPALTPTGALAALPNLKAHDLTPVIGREISGIQLRDILNAPNSEELLRDLAITVSQRNVVFLRNQDLTTDELKTLIQRLGLASGKPKDTGLHIHPVINSERDDGGNDNEISKISSELNKKVYQNVQQKGKRQDAGRLWHSDITFETAAPDYSVLQIREKPETGGDTLWASGYELYDRLSEPYQKFLETLTATYAQPGFNRAAERNGFTLYTEPRGSPLNIGEELSAVHPVIRTNPVTGWKSVYAVGHHVAKINDLTDRESSHLLKEFVKLITRNHDLQVRFHWGANDVAIWDNRSTYHTATYDLEENDVRWGDRAVGIAEVPYLDPESTGRREALGSKVPQEYAL
ncbi:alpha-ketoglutarate-dependent taurine dioxygenase [Ascodesmis nigricans]|uniref:Alpha-ketoglutarate-dependent taurine dioxygenase n=1 Tax=Ascodesmis nigricans TaxID=341454 RepID=A0A4S2MYW4_9PEZI|nr:alpha-ketoglutarate-dependent taurine dioxygenase [Ascodesmis nigricans]